MPKGQAIVDFEELEQKITDLEARLSESQELLRNKDQEIEEIKEKASQQLEEKLRESAEFFESLNSIDQDENSLKEKYLKQ